MTTPQITRQGVTPPGSPRDEPQTVQLKSRLVLLGESAVGKTSLVLQFVNGQFNDHQESTIGAAFFIQHVMLEDLNTRVKFEIWDTAGQERFHSLAPMYYRNAPAAIVVYDITNHESFLKSQTWVKELQKQGRPDVVIALAGNKLDLQDRRDVTYQEAEEYAQQNGLIFVETSARTGKHVRELFIELAKKVPKNVPTSPTGDRTRIDITQDESSSKPFFKFDCCNG